MIVASPRTIVDVASEYEQQERMRPAFPLFVLANAVLLLRPMDLLPLLKEVPLYEMLMLACLVASLPEFFAQFRLDSLYVRPITVCVLMLMPAVVLSHVSHLDFADAVTHAFAISKVQIYYLLMVATVDTPRRLRQFMAWLAVFVVGLSVLPLLQHHGLIHSEALSAVNERDFDQDSGFMVVLSRLRGAGIFQDPNDLCQMLGVGLILCLHWMVQARLMLLRAIWLGAFGALSYAVTLTSSRGGMLAVLAGLGTLFYSRYGLKRTLLLGAMALPLLLVFVGGRQMDISASSTTGQQRIRIWSDGLAMVRSAPVFGVGMGKFAEGADFVAHNSFLHSFAELGFFGGMFFLGAFTLAIVPLYRMRPPNAYVRDPELASLRPTLLAIAVAYTASMLSLSRNYVVPTYMILGLAAAWQAMAPVTPPLCFNGRLVRRLALLGVAFLIGLHLFVRMQIRWH